MFRREDLALRTFEPIRAARPSRLYLAADGPRSHVPGEAEACAQTRAAIEARIDWPCTVQRDYSASNLGCGRRVSSAIARAFEQEERLIIIEDDCLAEPTFFRFCDELLDRYEQDERVAMISGDQFGRGGWPGGGYSYTYVRLAQIWGWATWRRAWKNFDYELQAWPAERRHGLLERTFPRRRDRRYWTKNFDECLAIDSWDYQWAFARWRCGQVGIVPDRNLVSNLGFTGAALHTTDDEHPAAAVPRVPMEFPLRHPQHVALDDALDVRTARILFSTGDFRSWWKYQREQRLARWFPAIFKS